MRFAASKVMEGDTKILEQLKLTVNEQHLLEEIAKQTEEETGMDRAAAVAQMRFDYIEDICSETVIKPKESKERVRSRKADEFLTENIQEFRHLSESWELCSGLRSM